MTKELSVKNYSDNFEWVWQRKPKRNRPDNKKKAYKAWEARLKQGHTEREMATGVNHYGEHCDHVGAIGTPYVMMLATFLGPDLHFMDYQEKITDEERPPPTLK